MTTKNKYQIYFIAIAIITFITGVIFWSTAKDEIFYLCGNFSSGVEKSSVIRQLETANLSTYKQSMTKEGSRIVFSSTLNFVSYRCIIALDKNDIVINAEFM
jgi:hypothetical protein